MFPTLTPVTKNLIIINVVVFLAANFVYPQLYEMLSAYYPFSPNFRSWQIITHMFMHAPLGRGIGITHILFNLLTLWSFGPVLEHSLGSRRYTVLFFVSGLGGFLLFNLWNYYQVNELINTLNQQGANVAEIFRKSSFHYSGDMQISAPTRNGALLSQKLFEALRTPMLGASGAIFGVIAAFAALFPDARLFMMFIPIPIKAKYMLIGAVLISLYLAFTGGMGDVAHFAHIGGALAGFILAKVWEQKRFTRF